MEQDAKIEFYTQPRQSSPQQSTPQQGTPVPQVVQQGSEQIKYAGFWIRYAAVFIDGLILIIPNIIINVVFNALSVPIFGIISSYAVLWLYYILMTKKYGSTLGKKAVGIRVRSDKSVELAWGQLILRETIGKILSTVILSIGYLMAGFTERKQALHDKIAGTVVIYKDPDKKPKRWIMDLAIGSLLIIMIIVIMLVGLNDIRNKANDAATQATVSSMNKINVPEQSTTSTSEYTDADSGMSINYSSDWQQEASEKDAATFSLVSDNNLLATVSIQKFPSIPPDQFMNTLKAATSTNAGAISDEKAFTYTMQDGMVLLGKQAKFENPQNGQSGGSAVKRWVVAVPYKNSLYVWTYEAAKSSFDEFKLKGEVVAMLNSWKIVK